MRDFKSSQKGVSQFGFKSIILRQIMSPPYLPGMDTFDLKKILFTINQLHYKYLCLSVMRTV